MAITYKSSGAGVSTESSGGALSPACPAVVDAGDILILQTAWEGTTSAPSDPAGWTPLYGPQPVGSAPVARHWVYGRIADGSEDGAAVALGSPAVTTQRAARIHSFAGRVSGTIAELVPSASFSHLEGDTDPTGPTVVTTVAGALACALVYQNDNNTLETFASASDTWTERGTVGGYIFALNPGGVLDLLTATPDPDPSTVSGGAMTVTNDPWSVIGFEIRPQLPAVTGSGSPDAQSATADGSGVSGSTGSGTPDSQTAAVDGTGVSGSTGTGALAAQSASVAGEGEVEASEVTGDGALEAQSASIEGEGVSGSTGSGDIAAQAASADGEGVSLSTGTGTLSAQAAQADGEGVSSSTGTGALDCASASVSGSGEVTGGVVVETPVSIGSEIKRRQRLKLVASGTGALSASASSITGSGDVNWDDLNEATHLLLAA